MSKAVIEITDRKGDIQTFVIEKGKPLVTKDETEIQSIALISGGQERTADDLPVFEFQECEPCRSKPGSPLLCESCLRNRSTIGALKRRHILYAKERAMELVRTLGMEDWSVLARLEELAQLAKHKT